MTRIIIIDAPDKVTGALELETAMIVNGWALPNGQIIQSHYQTWGYSEEKKLWRYVAIAI